jgi:hypothetical protein
LNAPNIRIGFILTLFVPSKRRWHPESSFLMRIFHLSQFVTPSEVIPLNLSESGLTAGLQTLFDGYNNYDVEID